MYVCMYVFPLNLYIYVRMLCVGAYIRADRLEYTPSSIGARRYACYLGLREGGGVAHLADGLNKHSMVAGKVSHAVRRSSAAVVGCANESTFADEP